MRLVGGIKGAELGSLAQQFEMASGIPLGRNAADLHIVLYRGEDKSVLLLLGDPTTVCLEIPDVEDDICCSVLNHAKYGAATIISPSGEACRAFGQWREDQNGIGFCSEGKVLEKTAVTVAEGRVQYDSARNLLLNVQRTLAR